MSSKVMMVAGDDTSPTIAILGTVNAATSLTRPADANAYTAGDEVSDSVTQASAHWWVFTNAASGAGGGGYITKIRMSCSDKLNVGVLYRLFLYGATPTMVGDNAAYNLLKSEFPTRVGFFDLGPMVTGVGAGSDSAFIDLDVRKAYQCVSTDRNLYGVLVIQGAYTPVSAETFQLSITVERN